MALKKIFGQKRGPAKTILGKKKWSSHSRTGWTADDGLDFKGLYLLQNKYEMY